MFATSLAKKLKREYDQVDYVIGFPQMRTLTKNNPYIDEVYLSIPAGPQAQVAPGFAAEYNQTIQLGPLNYQVTPCEEYQQQAGIADPTPEFEIFVSEQDDNAAEHYIEQLRVDYGKPVLAIMANWQSKTYIFTPEQYEAGIDVPGLGYGGKHRDVQSIVNELIPHFTLLPVGMPNASQHETVMMQDSDSKSLTFEAALIKHCDAFIGTEGGLANLAAGVGCRTILTGDFVHQLYGPNGCIKKIANPQLGPDKYFPTVGHLMINPYYTDKQVAETIIESVKNGKV